ncbi:MAG TPA: alkaline phosphatase family protein, partial [Candidatus Dormibacteraeota bacterium]|nr:alkaline phosphatase family protein [Candidatus Dormibacteraeota bacterium]
MYRRRELPNLYALAGGGALFADFDVDGEVTAQGHQWTTAASDSDFVQRTWPAYYSDRGLVQNPGWTGPQADADTAHGNVPLGFDNPYGDYEDLSKLGAWSNPWISYPAGRFLFDDLAAHGVSFEDFGEFISRTEGGDVVPNVLAHTDTTFPGWNRFLLDTDRARLATRWIDAHRNGFPRFLYIWLPDDHTAGGAPCYYTPDYYVADNDAATGRIVAALSRLPVWRHMAVFITEDDAQSGADHIDAHRSFLVAAGPWIKSGTVETAPYSQVDMLRTAEAILGIPPLSQWDANARVIDGIWRATPNDAPIAARPMEVARAVNPGSCSRYTRLRRKAGEHGQILTRASIAAQAYTPTSLLKVAGPEQLRQEWIATHGLASYLRLQAYLARLAARRHAPLDAFIANEGD